MFRSIPVSNKLCFDKQLKRSWKIHEDKLRKLKGSVGKQKPQQFAFLDYRLKKNALKQIKNIEIERQNQILLRKMKQIQTKGCKNSYLLNTDNSPQKKKTLNQPYRKKQLIKIVGENQDIIKRIHQKKSAYNTKKMQQQRIQIQKNISLISEFPYKNYSAKNTPTNLWMTDENFHKRKHSPSPNENLEFTGTKKINDNYYLVSTYIREKMFFIQIQNLQNNREKYRMKMEDQQIRNLLNTSFQNNLNNVIESLEIDSATQSCYLRYKPISTRP